MVVNSDTVLWYVNSDSVIFHFSTESGGPSVACGAGDGQPPVISTPFRDIIKAGEYLNSSCRTTLASQQFITSNQGLITPHIRVSPSAAGASNLLKNASCCSMSRYLHRRGQDSPQASGPPTGADTSDAGQLQGKRITEVPFCCDRPSR